MFFWEIKNLADEKPQEVIEILREILASTPDNFEARLLKTNVHLRLAKESISPQDLDHVCEGRAELEILGRTGPAAPRCSIWEFSYLMAQYEELDIWCAGPAPALESYARALRYAPGSDSKAKVMASRGEFCTRIGLFDMAIQDLEEVIRQMPFFDLDRPRKMLEVAYDRKFDAECAYQD